MTYIPASLRRTAIERAGDCCEYCRIHRYDHILPFEIDHIIAERHGGKTEVENLCFSCYDCNHSKASDIATADPLTGAATFLFHPRKQNWDEHFQLREAFIEPISPEGRVTVFLLTLNDGERLEERQMLLTLGRYPCQMTIE